MEGTPSDPYYLTIPESNAPPPSGLAKVMNLVFVFYAGSHSVSGSWDPVENASFYRVECRRSDQPSNAIDVHVPMPSADFPSFGNGGAWTPGLYIFRVTAGNYQAN
jgi:hypothetical protein